jgi:hypothetical protein
VIDQLGESDLRTEPEVVEFHLAVSELSPEIHSAEMSV